MHPLMFGTFLSDWNWLPWAIGDSDDSIERKITLTNKLMLEKILLC